MSKALGGLLLGLGVVLIAIGGVIAFEQNVINEAQYNRVIGDWAKNAQDAPTFQQSITFLQKFNASMNSEGLSPSQYNSPWGWDQTPQNSMVFQYSYIGQMIDRANYYINYTSANHAGQLTDIYNTALTNFRNEMDHNGPLDWVAHDAWMLKNGFYWNNLYATLLILPGIAVFVIGLFYASDDD